MCKSAHAPVTQWKIVCRAMGLLSAEAIRGRLETAGIPVSLDYDSTSTLLGIPAFGGTGEVRVLVPIDRITEARELIGRECEVDEDSGSERSAKSSPPYHKAAAGLNDLLNSTNAAIVPCCENQA